MQQVEHIRRPMLAGRGKLTQESDRELSIRFSIRWGGCATVPGDLKLA